MFFYSLLFWSVQSARFCLKTEKKCRDGRLQSRRSFVEEFQVEGVQILTQSLEGVSKPIFPGSEKSKSQVKSNAYSLSQVALACDSGFSEVLKRPLAKGLAQSLQKGELPTECRVSAEEYDVFQLELPWQLTFAHGWTASRHDVNPFVFWVGS